MQIELTSEEARTLHGLLRDTLPDLRREIARTELHNFGYELVQRQRSTSDWLSHWKK